MSKAVYIFKEHENFEAGKTRLKIAAVVRPDFTAFVSIFPISFVMLWLLGILLLANWSELQREASSTSGILLSCETEKNDRGRVTATYANFEYIVADVTYNARSEWSSRGCDNFPTGAQRTVYFDANHPENAKLNRITTDSLLFLGFCAGGLSFIWLLPWLISVASEIYAYNRFRRADTIFEATVIKVKEAGPHRLADYLFFNYDKEKLPGRIESHWSYRWPEALETGDILYILYLDDKTYCVL